MNASGMNFGVALPNAREGGAYEPGRGFATIDAITQMARTAELNGFDTLWLDDHLVEHGAAHGEPQPGILESVTVAAYLAATTAKIRIGIGVIVLPLRDPVLLARQFTVLDHISKGRTVLGIGIGIRHELEVARPTEAGMHRWKTTLARARAIRALFDQGEASVSQEHTAFGPMSFTPQPVQRPLPIHVATHLSKNLPAMASFAHGWHIAGKTPEEIEALVADLDAALRDEGRSRSGFEVIGHFQIRIDDDADVALGIAKRSSPWMRQRGSPTHPSYILGHPDKVAARLTSYREAGLSGTSVIFLADDPDDACDQLERFAAEVMPRMGAAAPTG